MASTEDSLELFAIQKLTQFSSASKCSHGVRGITLSSAFMLHFTTFKKTYCPLTITGRSMLSEIQTSETSKPALTRRLLPPRVPTHSFQLLQLQKLAIQSTCVLLCTQTTHCQSPSVSSTELNRYYAQKGAAITYLIVLRLFKKYN